MPRVTVDFDRNQHDGWRPASGRTRARARRIAPGTLILAPSPYTLSLLPRFRCCMKLIGLQRLTDMSGLTWASSKPNGYETFLRPRARISVSARAMAARS
eukprot:3907864-Rhodomonas_salina.1